MKISFLTTHLGIFGSIRELIENANRLVYLGNDVTIYTQDGIHPVWLYCVAKVKKAVLPALDNCDVLVMMDSPFDYNYTLFENTRARFKTFVMMGFDHTTLDLKMVDGQLVNLLPKQSQTERNLLEIFKHHTICADGQWQLNHFKKFGIKTGVAIGGINTRQFFNYRGLRMIDVGYSGDTRPRKGTVNLSKALESLNYKSDFYWKKYDQLGIPAFLNNCKIFVDNHLRAGWCNPVLEAISCGCVTICNNIQALADFAIDGKTAIVLDDNSPEKFIEKITDAVEHYPDFYRLFNRNAEEIASEWDYDIVTRRFEKYLLSKI
jgi:hypothetical protein